MSELQKKFIEELRNMPFDQIFETTVFANKAINLCMDAAKAKGGELKSRSKNQVLWKEIDIHNYRNGYLNAIDDFVKAIESLKEQDK